MTNAFGKITYTPIIIEEDEEQSYQMDIDKSPDVGTLWAPSCSELLYITVEQTAMPDPEEAIEYYILQNIEKIPKGATMLFVGNRKIAITGWSFEDRETYYDKEWFSLKDAACFVYDGRNVYLLYADYVGMWNKGKYLVKIE